MPFLPYRAGCGPSPSPSSVGPWSSAPDNGRGLWRWLGNLRPVTWCHPSFWTRSGEAQVCGVGESVPEGVWRGGDPISFPAPSAHDPSSRSSSLLLRPLSWCLETSGTAVGAESHYSRQRVESRLNIRVIRELALRGELCEAQTERGGCRDVPSWRASRVLA